MRNNSKKGSAPEKLSLNIGIVGGGRACKFFLGLLQNQPFDYLDIRIAGICDINPDAEGFRLARDMGIYTTDNFEDLFKIEGLDGVIELTGSREVLLELIRTRPKGLSILEHNIGKLLRTLFLKDEALKSAMKEATLDKMAADFLMQQANERISVLSPDFRIVEANEAYLDAVGKSRDEVIGAHCYEITHGISAPCSRSQPGLGCPLLETLRSGESAHVLHEHSFHGNPPTYCDLVTYPLKDQNGEVVRVIEVCRDLTGELASRWEKRIKEMKTNLKKLVQEDRMISLGKLVASSVHEINNPIQGLLTFSGLMQDILNEGDPSAEDLERFKHYLSMMSKELERCGNIVSGLLSFSRQSEMAFKDVDLNEVLEQVLSLTSHKMEIQNIKLSSELYEGPLVLNGDVNQLQQCFLNLIFNAMEAMPEGGELRVTSDLDRSRQTAVIRIEDTGYGIAKEDLGHIFDPFFTTKGEGEGTGLGLSIVYGILKNHGGDIQVQSRLGEGSAFVLSLPVK